MRFLSVPLEPEDDRWRAKFLLKEPMDFDMMEHKCVSNQVRKNDLMPFAITKLYCVDFLFAVSDC